jgi:hypothetical protein
VCPKTVCTSTGSFSKRKKEAAKELLALLPCVVLCGACVGLWGFAVVALHQHTHTHTSKQKRERFVINRDTPFPPPFTLVAVVYLSTLAEKKKFRSREKRVLADSVFQIVNRDQKRGKPSTETAEGLLPFGFRYGTADNVILL